ncbi:hypothetical protein GX563_01390 [Candidatus Bathyarchaeota archaeon]|nr:hypothetical protein [Candidatus Bathyarchaeota archaeon]
MSSDAIGCKDCKRVREHVASLLPFKVIESTQGKPLRIGGVAMAAGMSRNFNVYTPEELAVFAEKLVNAPVYIEHVTAETAAGKVTKCNYDAASRSLLYEAEIYDQAIADKVRNGLIQHVSVGADYSLLDVVDAKVPHGLFNPELSLVAVPGIPETNIKVLEKVEDKQLKEKLAQTEGKLSEAEKTIEDLRKQVPGGGLLKNPPKMMAVSEHVTVLEGLLPPLVVERSSMGMQRQAQAVRAALFRAKERLAGG